MFHRFQGCRPARLPAKFFVRRRRPVPSHGFRPKPQPGQNQGAADTGPSAVTGSHSQFFVPRERPRQAGHRNAGKIRGVFSVSAEVKGGGESPPPLCRWSRRYDCDQVHIFKCRWPKFSGQCSAGRQPGARVRFEIRPFEADAGQRQQHAGRGSWSARAVRNPYSRHPGHGWTTMTARPCGRHYEERVMGKSGTSGNTGKGGVTSPGTRQSTTGGSSSGGGARPGAGAGQGPGNAGGWPSTTGGTSGGGRSNGKPR